MMIKHIFARRLYYICGYLSFLYLLIVSFCINILFHSFWVMSWLVLLFLVAMVLLCACKNFGIIQIIMYIPDDGPVWPCRIYMKA
jgi:hypothetical protein